MHHIEKLVVSVVEIFDHKIVKMKNQQTVYRIVYNLFGQDRQEFRTFEGEAAQHQVWDLEYFYEKFGATDIKINRL
jgi:hypothetical protein